MPESSHEGTSYDDQLARFTDQVTSGDQPQIQEEDGEMAALMETVARLERVFSADRPDPARARRIKANLLKEWEISGPAVGQDTFWKRLWPGWSSVPRRQMAGYAVGMVALLVVAAAVFLPGSAPGTASTGGGAYVPTMLIVAGLAVLGGVLWWLNRPPR